MVATAPARRYAGASAAERRDDRRARLLEAGLDALGTEGYAGATVRGVCARARLTPRYFYESFGDLDALLVAVFDEVAAGAAGVVLAAVAGSPSEAHARAQAAIGAFVGFVTDDPRRARVLFVEARDSTPLVRRRAQSMRAFVDLVAREAGDFYGVRRGGEPLVDLTATLLVGGTAQLLVTWLDGDLGVDRETLVADLSALFVAVGEGAVALARERGR
jgi:AcrR family transcriptional regulator